MQLHLSRETLASFALGDATLQAIRWVSDGRDLALDLVLGDGQRATLVCTWAAGACIDLHAASNELGGPLSWDCEWEEDRGRWLMSLDFDARGTVRLACNGAVLSCDADD